MPIGAAFEEYDGTPMLVILTLNGRTSFILTCLLLNTILDLKKFEAFILLTFLFEFSKIIALAISQ